MGEPDVKEIRVRTDSELSILAKDSTKTKLFGEKVFDTGEAQKEIKELADALAEKYKDDKSLSRQDSDKTPANYIERVVAVEATKDKNEKTLDIKENNLITANEIQKAVKLANVKIVEDTSLAVVQDNIPKTTTTPTPPTTKVKHESQTDAETWKTYKELYTDTLNRFVNGQINFDQVMELLKVHADVTETAIIQRGIAEGNQAADRYYANLGYQTGQRGSQPEDPNKVNLRERISANDPEWATRNGIGLKDIQTVKVGEKEYNLLPLQSQQLQYKTLLEKIDTGLKSNPPSIKTEDIDFISAYLLDWKEAARKQIEKYSALENDKITSLESAGRSAVMRAITQKNPGAAELSDFINADMERAKTIKAAKKDALIQSFISRNAHDLLTDADLGFANGVDGVLSVLKNNSDKSTRDSKRTQASTKRNNRNKGELDAHEKGKADFGLIELFDPKDLTTEPVNGNLVILDSSRATPKSSFKLEEKSKDTRSLYVYSSLNPDTGELDKRKFPAWNGEQLKKGDYVFEYTTYEDGTPTRSLYVMTKEQQKAAEEYKKQLSHQIKRDRDGIDGALDDVQGRIRQAQRGVSMARQGVSLFKTIVNIAGSFKR